VNIGLHLGHSQFWGIAFEPPSQCWMLQHSCPACEECYPSFVSIGLHPWHANCKEFLLAWVKAAELQCICPACEKSYQSYTNIGLATIMSPIFKKLCRAFHQMLKLLCIYTAHEEYHLRFVIPVLLGQEIQFAWLRAWLHLGVQLRVLLKVEIVRLPRLSPQFGLMGDFFKACLTSKIYFLCQAPISLWIFWKPSPEVQLHKYDQIPEIVFKLFMWSWSAGWWEVMKCLIGDSTFNLSPVNKDERSLVKRCTSNAHSGILLQDEAVVLPTDQRHLVDDRGCWAVELPFRMIGDV